MKYLLSSIEKQTYERSVLYLPLFPTIGVVTIVISVITLFDVGTHTLFVLVVVRSPVFIVHDETVWKQHTYTQIRYDLVEL